MRHIARQARVEHRAECVATNAADRGRQVARTHDLGALLVDHLALVVGDVVEQQQLLADVEVMRFDLALRFLDAA